jgi:hypothetical protein
MVKGNSKKKKSVVKGIRLKTNSIVYRWWEILDKYGFEAIEAWYMAQRFIRKIENRKHINDSAFGIVSFERLNKVDDIDKIEEIDVYITLTTFNYRSENAPKGSRGVGTVWLRKLEDEDKWELYDYDATLWGG